MGWGQISTLEDRCKKKERKQGAEFVRICEMEMKGSIIIIIAFTDELEVGPRWSITKLLQSSSGASVL